MAEKKSISFVISLTGLTLLVFSSLLALSSYLASEPQRRFAEGHAAGEIGRGKQSDEAPGHGGETLAIPPELLAAKQAVEDAPEDLEAQLRYADLSAGHALASGDGQLLIDAVEQYSRIVKEHPENSRALKSIASISFRAGVFDKAETYYRRYLELNPDDSKALADYALVKLQAGDRATSESILQSQLEKDPDSVPLLLASAVLKQRGGELDAALELAQRANRKAGTESEKTAAKMMTEMLQFSQSGQQSVQDSGTDAPAAKALLRQFAESHPILGSKLERIEWKSESEAVVILRDFPVGQMPDVARQKLRERVIELFAAFPEAYTIRLGDVSGGEELVFRSR